MSDSPNKIYLVLAYFFGGLFLLSFLVLDIPYEPRGDRYSQAPLDKYAKVALGLFFAYIGYQFYKVYKATIKDEAPLKPLDQEEE